jgi:hypothetical protein
MRACIYSWVNMAKRKIYPACSDFSFGAVNVVGDGVLFLVPDALGNTRKNGNVCASGTLALL